MLKKRDIYCGCSAQNNVLKVLKDGSICYISNNNVVIRSKNSCPRVLFLESYGRCMSKDRGDNRLLVGDESGNGYLIIDEEVIKRYEVGESVVTCAFLGDQYVVFGSISTLYIFSVFSGILMSKGRIESKIIAAVLGLREDSIAVGFRDGSLGIYRANMMGEIQVLNEVSAHEDSIRDMRLNNEGSIFATASQDSTVKLWLINDKVLSPIQTLNSHSDWVNSVVWNKERLITASSDKTIRVWEKDESSGLFISVSILGGSVEFLGCDFWEDCLYVQCKTGGIDVYRADGIPHYVTSGHLRPVSDISWMNDFLLTSSADYTSRIFYKGKERGRPQIHGYPIASVSFLPLHKFQFISAAQEPILRIYEATLAFFYNCNLQPDEKYFATAVLSELNPTNEIVEEYYDEGLSESSLASNVFVETKKLYGHFFDLKYVTCNSSLIFSCNNSLVKKFAGLFVWDISSKDKVQYITDHSMEIQHIYATERFVLTVSKDMTSCLYSVKDQRLKLRKKNADHSRNIWYGGIDEAENAYATCGRDGCICLYSIDKEEMVAKREFVNEEPTALCFMKNTIIVGFRSGVIKALDYGLQVLWESKIANDRIKALKPNKELLAVSSNDSSVHILEMIVKG